MHIIFPWALIIFFVSWIIYAILYPKKNDADKVNFYYKKGFWKIFAIVFALLILLNLVVNTYNAFSSCQ